MKKILLLITCITFFSVCRVSAQGDMGNVMAVPVYRTIVIDGNMGDWEGIQPATTDEIGDGGLYFDFAAAYLANDTDNLYIRITFSEPQPYGSFFWYMNTAFDTDLSRATGHRWIADYGSEFVVQGLKVFDQRCGGWVCLLEEPGEVNDWGAFAYVVVSPMNDQNVQDIEISIPRNLLYQDMENGQPGLSNPDESPLFDPILEEFVVLFEAQDENFQSVEWMPDLDPATNQAGISYIFADTPTDVIFWDIH